MALNAFLHHLQNFMVLLIEGSDNICNCTCGRYQVHHVVPFNVSQQMVATESFTSIITEHQICMMTGMIIGLCIGVFIQWLERARH